MSATILPFPTVRRRPMILRNARRLAILRDPEKALRSLVAGVRQAHERKGVATDQLERDVAEFEAALLAHMVRFRCEVGGVA